MKQAILASLALTLGMAACGDQPAGDKPMYDTSARAVSGSSAERDSLTAQVARDSAGSKPGAAGAKSDSAGAGGGVPQGTIDSGMINAGAQKTENGMKPHRHKAK